MTRPIQVGASLACANFAALEGDLRQLAAAAIDYLHIDIMDGLFVDNFALDFSILRTVRQITTMPLVCHLMIEQPERYLDRAATAGAGTIIIHVEATRHVQKALQTIRDGGLRAGIALNPATAIDCLDYILDDLDVVTVMTVNPGAAGQRLIPAMLKKIADVRHRLESADRDDIEIEVDGNVSFANIPEMVRAGATMLVGGTSSIFQRGYSIAEAVATVRNRVRTVELLQ